MVLELLDLLARDGRRHFGPESGDLVGCFHNSLSSGVSWTHVESDEQRVKSMVFRE
jgi:hypothetical protein